MLFCFYLLFFSVNVYAEKLKIQKVSDEIIFDGKPDELAWQLVDTLPITMHSPIFNGKPSERTLVRVAYDQQYLWIAGELLVNHSSDIRATSKKRDEMSANSDFFGVVIDSYSDNENGLGFFTTPTGLRLDAAISNDASSRDPLNPDWNTFWDVKTTRDENGWYCEFRIPFSSLRFQAVNGITEMGMIIWRWSAHINENVTFPSIDPKYGMWATWKPSLAHKVLFEKIEPAKPVYLSPYVLGGFTADNSLNEEETEYIHDEKFSREIGGDLKYCLTSNLTMDLTLNTDFAQVEADDQKINLTRYSLFFPEKRMFFQERASVFSFDLGGPNDLFYSRKIGLDDDGNPVRILGGARVYGRMGKWDLGLLNMQTGKSGELPSENFGVLRARKQVFNANSYVGGILTTRLGANGNYNLAYGIDGIMRVFGDDYLDVKFAQSVENGINSKFASLDPSKIRLSWRRRSEEGLGYYVSYSYSGVNFNPGVGFEYREDYQGFRTQLQWGWLPGPESKLFSHNLNISFNNTYNILSGEILSGSVGPGWEFQTKGFLIGMIELKRIIENVEEEFSFSEETDVPVGYYEFYGFEGMMVTPMTRKVFAEIMFEGGQFYDGERFSLTLNPYLNLSSSFQINGSYQFDAINFGKRKQSLRNHITRLKFEYMHSTKLSASSFVQYNTLNAAFIANFRLRYNPREGNDFYVVFNEIRNLKPGIETPRLPKLGNRTVLLKYTHTFIL